MIIADIQQTQTDVQLGNMVALPFVPFFVVTVSQILHQFFFQAETK